MGNVLAQLRTPPAETYNKVTFPEGFTVGQMAERIDEKVVPMTADGFDRAMTDPALVVPFRPPGVTTLEGLLFPDTYQVSNGENEAQVISRMLSQMERVGGQEDIVTKGQRLMQSPYGILIIASMIEREAKTDEDRPKIARVIYNRLAIDMPLQIDAAVRYGTQISGGDPDAIPFDQQRQTPGPYNTYLNEGCRRRRSPTLAGRRSSAALNPAPNPSVGDPLCADLPDGHAVPVPLLRARRRRGQPRLRRHLEQHQINVSDAAAAGVLLDDRRRAGRPRVIGSPIDHSLSPALHHAGFAAAGVDWDVRGLRRPRRIRRRRASRRCAPSASAGCPSRRRTRRRSPRPSTGWHRRRPRSAVNTVRRGTERLVGHSTDGDGFVASLAAAGVDVGGAPRRRRRRRRQRRAAWSTRSAGPASPTS